MGGPSTVNPPTSAKSQQTAAINRWLQVQARITF
jgi:hypothetical protein